MPVDNIGSDVGAYSRSVELCFEVVSANEILVWDMFVVAMTPNQDLRTNLISNLYSPGA
jgi:hypothetical protein